MGNWVDLVIITILILFALEGFGRPFLGEMSDLLGFFLALVGSLVFYNSLAGWLQNHFSLPHSLANVVGFFLAWFVIETLAVIAFRLILSRLKLSTPSLLNRSLGFIPSLVKGLVLVSVFLVLLSTLPVAPKFGHDLKRSKIAGYLIAKTYGLEAPLKNIFGELSNDTLTFLTVKPKTNESVALGFTTTDFKFNSALESQMADLVNKARVSKGINALAYNNKLSEVARLQSADMFKRGYFSHYSPEGKTVADRAESLGVKNYTVIGENLAYAPNLEVAHQGLMASQGHRENILSLDYTKIGIGVAETVDNGIMFTQVFSN